MPIRAECADCGAVAELSDDAAGRLVKCRECGTPKRVPGGDSERERPRRKKKPARRKKAAKKKGEKEEVNFDDLDFGKLAKQEQREQGIGSGAIIECPECGETVAEKVDECPYCGEFVATRVKTERREKIRRELIGEKPNTTPHMIVIGLFVAVLLGAVAYFTQFAPDDADPKPDEVRDGVNPNAINNGDSGS